MIKMMCTRTNPKAFKNREALLCLTRNFVRDSNHDSKQQTKMNGKSRYKKESVNHTGYNAGLKSKGFTGLLKRPMVS